MLNAYRYIVAVDFGLVQLGCPPARFRTELRRLAQEYGLSQGLSPHDVAVMLVKCLSAGQQPDGWRVVAKAWRTRGKVRQPLWEGPGMLELAQYAAATRHKDLRQFG